MLFWSDNYLDEIMITGTIVVAYEAVIDEAETTPPIHKVLWDIVKSTTNNVLYYSMFVTFCIMLRNKSNCYGINIFYWYN